MKKRKDIDWIIHYLSNNVVCNSCGNQTENFLPYICDAHTHGMDKYNHPEFQVVLDLGPGMIGYLLNSMGYRVQAGETFKDGDVVTGITSTKESEDLPLRLKEVESNGKKLLRIILPDEKYRFPDDEGCQEVYNLQHMPNEFLLLKEENAHS